MCGFAGYVSLRHSPGHDDLGDVVQKMSQNLRHRGPDDSGIWTDYICGVAFGHQRLSIIDLSIEGRQPMHSACDRFVLVYNGEIYNFQDIKAELVKSPVPSPKLLHFRGYSDSEVLLAAISTWGVEKTLERANGMFAFALWDRSKKQLTLARDRFGKKPLYYGWVDGAFVFGSELKALKAHPGFKNEINRNSLTLYLQHNCIPAPYSIYRNIHKLSAGSVCALMLDDLRESRCYEDISGRIERYWLAEQVCSIGQAEPFTESPDTITEQLDALLRDAVAERMIADVPLGAFLSGGVDSSLVVALMQVQSERPVKTFTIGFDEAAYNEAEDARKVAEYLGTDHHEHYLSPQDVLDVVPSLPEIYDEPFADSSQIPTYLVAKFARQHVIVTLSGDGGDELFGGYNRYAWAPEIWAKMHLWPSLFRGSVAALLDCVSPQSWPRLLARLGLDHRTPADKMQKLADVLRSPSPADIYKTLVSHWKQPADIVIDGVEPLTRFRDAGEIIEHFGFAGGMMVLDQLTYLTDDILVKVDRASMAVSLEVRNPLLDYRIAEFASRVPMDQKIRKRQGKALLRKLLERYVPNELTERPKAGFEMPIASWLRGPLREWAEDLMSEDRLKNDGYFYPGSIRQCWDEHLAGKRNWQFHLWDVLMFQAWLARQGG